MEITVTTGSDDVYLKKETLSCPFRIRTYKNNMVISDKNTVNEYFEEFRPCLKSGCMAFYSTDGVSCRCRRLQYG